MLLRLASLWIVVFGLAMSAQAQDPEGVGRIVFVDLPSGATIRAGALERVLEEDAQGRPYILYPVGRMKLFISAPGERLASARLEVAEEAETRVQYRPVPFSIMRAGYTVVVPGVPQLLDGRPAVGAGIIAGLGASVGGIVWAGQRMEDARLEAAIIETRYELAATEAEAVAAREAHALAVQDAEAARTARIAFVGLGAVVYAAAVFDGLRRHTRGSTIDVWEPERPTVALRPSGTGVALQIRL